MQRNEWSTEKNLLHIICLDIEVNNLKLHLKIYILNSVVG